MDSKDRSTFEAERLLRVKDVAAICGVSTRHIYRLKDRGQMPAPMKLGSSTRWRERDISEWIENMGPRTEAK